MNNETTFTSDYSGKELPVSEQISASVLTPKLLEYVRKLNTTFRDTSVLSRSEYIKLRQSFIHDYLTEELGELSNDERRVLEALQQHTILTDKIEADDDTNERLFGQKLADSVAEFGGSWKFISSFMFFLLLWIILNSIALLSHPFDPYPFILLNLILSCIAALQAPIIMMSQNRQEEKDRERAKKDYMINLKSELEIRILHEKVDQLLQFVVNRLSKGDV